MTSKEALKRIKDDIEINYLTTKHNNEKDKHNYLELLKIIEKDLKLLEILKTKVFDEMKCFDLNEGWYDDIFYLNENQIKVIKEWLNDK